jgi:hypothetical protein
LIARDPRRPERDWDPSNPAGSQLIFVDAVAFLPFALERGLREKAQDVERVIIDTTGTPVQYLDLLASLPSEFVGDVLHIREDGGGYLSSVGRGGDRVLDSLTGNDVNFYLETNALSRASVSREESKDADSKFAIG